MQLGELNNEKIGLLEKKHSLEAKAAKLECYVGCPGSRAWPASRLMEKAALEEKTASEENKAASYGEMKCS